MKAINQNRFRNLCIGLSVACCFVLWAFNLEQVVTETVITITASDGDPYIEISSYTPEVEKKEEVKQERKREIEPPKENSAIKIVNDFKDLKVKRSIVNIDPFKSLSTHRIVTPIKTAKSDLVHPDVLPHFPGGKGALRKFLEDNLKYPEYCLEIDREGTVVVRFIVDETGSISHAVVVKDEMGYDAPDEALRVTRSMPKWKPGLKDGQPVKSYFIQSFRFKMY